MFSSTFPNNVFRWIRTTALVIRSQALIPLGHGCNQHRCSSYRVIHHICTNGSVLQRLYIYLQIYVYTGNKHNRLSQSLSTQMQLNVKQNKLLNFRNYVCIFFTKYFVKYRYYVIFIASN